MKRSLLLSILLTVLMAMVSALAIGPALAHAEIRLVVPGGPAITFQEKPTWVVVPGTRVYLIEQNARPDFDLFRHGSYYYAYRDGNWYRARTWNGRYTKVPVRYLPAQFDAVPRAHWRAYPPGWEKRAAKAKAAGRGRKK